MFGGKSSPFILKTKEKISSTLSTLWFSSYWVDHLGPNLEEIKTYQTKKPKLVLLEFRQTRGYHHAQLIGGLFLDATTPSYDLGVGINNLTIDKRSTIQCVENLAQEGNGKLSNLWSQIQCAEFQSGKRGIKKEVLQTM